MHNTYVPDTTYHALADALASLDPDPAHPEPLRDRIVWALSEANVWPASIEGEADQ